jgi:hypothetical protein
MAAVQGVNLFPELAALQWLSGDVQGWRERPSG